MRLLFVALVWGTITWGQIQSNTARHIIYSSSLPATCNFRTGDVWAVVGGSSTVYYTCTAANTWTAIGSGGGGSGTVTSVGLVGTANQITVTGASPITTSGSWTLSFPTNPILPGTTTGTYTGSLTDGIGMAGSILATAISAPGTPAAGKGSIYVDSTTKNLSIKDDAGTIKHGIQTGNCINSFARSVSDAGVITCNAVTTSDISGTTGSGNFVLATSPTLVTPTLGTASATTINKVTLTAPATGSTLTIAEGKTLTASNTLTFTGTDSSSVAFGGGGTVAYTANNLSVFAATTSAQLAGVLSDETGSGVAVFGTSPTLTTPAITTSATLSNNNILNVSTDGSIVQNTTAADATNTAQRSPRIRFIGAGWKTNATAASQQTEWLVENIPFSRAVAPDNALVFTPVRNGSSSANPLYMCQSDTTSGTTNGPVGFYGLDGAGSPRCDSSAGFAGFGNATTQTANVFSYYANAAQQMNFTLNGLLMKSGGFYAWGSGTNPSNSTTGDAGLCRGAAGQVNVNDGSTTCTTARDIASRTHVGIGSAPTVDATSCTGATIGTGAVNTGGTITGLPTGTCTVVLTFSGTTATTGWSCGISDQTTGNLFRQTASSTTTATFNGTSVSGDVLRYGPCMAF